MTGWADLGVPVAADIVSARRAELLDRALARLG